MTSEIECARDRLQAILSQLEQECSEDEDLSPEGLHDMHSLTHFLHENGFNVATVWREGKLVVEIEPFAKYECAA